MTNIEYNPPVTPNETPLGTPESIPNKEDAPPVPEAPGEETDTPVETINQEETGTPEIPEAEKPTNQERQPTLKEFKAMDGAKKHFEEENKKLKEQLKDKTPTPELPTSNNPMDVVKLSKALEGYNEEEVAFITRNAENKSIDGVIAASKDEMVKIAIEAKRTKIKTEQSIPEPSSPSSGGNLPKEIPKKHERKKEDEVREIQIENLKKHERQERTSGI